MFSCKFRQDSENYTPLHFACDRGHVDIAERLIEMGSDLNVQTLEGYTPLYLASQGNHSLLVNLLLSHKARHDIEEEDGWTALQVGGKLVVD